MRESDWSWVSAGALSDIPDGSGTVIDRGDLEIGVFRSDDRVWAMNNRCLHNGGSLAEGMVRNGVVTCPLHWWRYDLPTGSRLGAPQMRLTCYEVKVQGGEVLVRCPPIPVVRSLREQLLAHAKEWIRENPRHLADPAP